MYVLYCLRLLIFMVLLISSSPHGKLKHNSIELLPTKDVKIKRTKVRIMYYSNHTASFQATEKKILDLFYLGRTVMFCEKLFNQIKKDINVHHALIPVMLCVSKSFYLINSRTAINGLVTNVFIMYYLSVMSKI